MKNKNMRDRMKIIIINGSAESGKDQFVEYFKKNYKNKCFNLSTIDKVKKITMKNFGWNGEKTEESRKFLSDVKKLWSDFNNGPFEDMIKQIEKYQSKLGNKERKNAIYFIHCREPLEIQKFVDKYEKKCVTVLIKRIDIIVPNNDSDKNVEDFNYTYTIDNNDSKKILKEKAIQFIEELSN